MANEIEMEPAEHNIASHDAPASNMDAISLYLKEVSLYPLLSKEEELHYGRLAREGDSEARRKMIVSNLRLVIKMAKRYLGSPLPLLDLIEEGNLGLMHAVEKFDPERGFRFSTYATWWIRQSIERGIMNQSDTIRVPIHVKKELNCYRRVARELEQSGCHEAGAEQIAEAVCKPIGHVRNLLQLNTPTQSLDPLDSGDIDKSLLNILPDLDETDPAEQLQLEDETANLEHCLGYLGERERQVIELRFGINGKPVTTLEELGELLGVTRERVRQIQKQAIIHLRQLMEHGLTESSLKAVA